MQLPGMSFQIPGSDPQNPKYVVNMANMVQYIRSNLVKCTARDRYGKETARILEVRRTARTYVKMPVLRFFRDGLWYKWR